MDALRFNTAIAKLIELNNHVTKLAATATRGRRAVGADAGAARAARRRGAVAHARPRRHRDVHRVPRRRPGAAGRRDRRVPGAGQRQGARPDHGRRSTPIGTRSRPPPSPTPRSSAAIDGASPKKVIVVPGQDGQRRRLTPARRRSPSAAGAVARVPRIAVAFEGVELVGRVPDLGQHLAAVLPDQRCRAADRGRRLPRTAPAAGCCGSRRRSGDGRPAARRRGRRASRPRSRGSPARPQKSIQNAVVCVASTSATSRYRLGAVLDPLGTAGESGIIVEVVAATGREQTRGSRDGGTGAR